MGKSFITQYNHNSKIMWTPLWFISNVVDQRQYNENLSEDISDWFWLPGWQNIFAMTNQMKVAKNMDWRDTKFAVSSLFFVGPETSAKASNSTKPSTAQPMLSLSNTKFDTLFAHPQNIWMSIQTFLITIKYMKKKLTSWRLMASCGTSSLPSLRERTVGGTGGADPEDALGDRPGDAPDATNLVLSCWLVFTPVN